MRKPADGVLWMSVFVCALLTWSPKAESDLIDVIAEQGYKIRKYFKRDEKAQKKIRRQWSSQRKLRITKVKAPVQRSAKPRAKIRRQRGQVPKSKKLKPSSRAYLEEKEKEMQAGDLAEVLGEHPAWTQTDTEALTPYLSPYQKLGRGISNLTSAPLEMIVQPARMATIDKKPALSIFGGPFQGVHYTLKRTALGLRDLFTFPSSKRTKKFGTIPETGYGAVEAVINGQWNYPQGQNPEFYQPEKEIIPYRKRTEVLT